MKKSISVLLGIFIMTFYADAQTDSLKILVNGNNKFAFELYKNLMTRQGNLFFSPYSISTTLAMTYAGAKGNTQAQMANVLHFELPQEFLHPEFKKLIDITNGKTSAYQLNVANALWGQKGYSFLSSFIELTKENYGAGLNEVDFKRATETARRTINAWVEKETQNKIKDLIQPGVLDVLTRLVLTNAIYFKGNWANEFEKKLTKDLPFYVAPEKEIQTPMMYKKGDFNFLETKELQILELPYKSKELSMIVLLPKKIDGLADVEDFITPEFLNNWLENFDEIKVEVYLPKFKTTSAFSLKENLSAMGMPNAFSQKSADFSGMNGNNDLYISEVIHKAFVDVNEEGTEAAAATAVVMKLKGGMVERIPVFRADHPFIFLIRDNRSGSILFMGRLENPGEK